MNIENQKDKPTWEGLEQYFAVEVIEQAKKSSNRWFHAWVITFVIGLAAFIGTNAYWIHIFQSYDYITQDGTGPNNINTGTQGDLENGTESQD